MCGAIMHLFAITSGTCKFRLWLTRAALAIALLVPAWAQASADPRIDHDTTTIRAQQVAALQKSRDGVVQQAGLASWYGRHWRGRKTASGMVFEGRSEGAPGPVWLLPTRAHVTNLQ